MSDRCDIHFKESVDEVDITSQTLKTSSGNIAAYDLLIGADESAAVRNV